MTHETTEQLMARLDREAIKQGITALGNRNRQQNLARYQAERDGKRAAEVAMAQPIADVRAPTDDSSELTPPKRGDCTDEGDYQEKLASYHAQVPKP